MCSRGFILLGLLASFALLFASEVAAARDLAETASSTDKTDSNGENEAKFPGGGYGGVRGEYRGAYGGVGGGCHGAGGYRCGYGRGRGGYGGGGRGGCNYGCCACRCCASAAEAAQMAVEVKPQN